MRLFTLLYDFNLFGINDFSHGVCVWSDRYDSAYMNILLLLP